MSDYADLQASIGAFLNRQDLAGIIPAFIALAEAELNRVLDCREMVEFANLGLDTERVLLPTGFAGVKSFRLSAPARELTYVSPDTMDGFDGCAGAPHHYTIVGDSFTLWPAPGSTVSARLRYRRRLEPLALAGTNWLLETHLDAYLYGALKHSAPYLVEDERIALWQGLFDRAVEQINDDGRKQLLGSRLQSRPGALVI
jgi:hypothetical protein